MMLIKYVRAPGTEQISKISFEKGSINVKLGRGIPIGCVVSTARGKVGYSLCNVKAGDVFVKKTALSLAKKKIVDFDSLSDKQKKKLPVSLIKDIEQMRDRSFSYFKTEEQLALEAKMKSKISYKIKKFFGLV